MNFILNSTMKEIYELLCSSISAYVGQIMYF